MMDDPGLLEEITKYIKRKKNPLPQFVRDPDEFERLALRLAQHQYHTIPAYQRWVDFRGEKPSKWECWWDILPFPVTFFKHMDVSVEGAKKAVWLSSGTTSKDRSRVGLNTLDFYDLVIKKETEELMSGPLGLIISLMPTKEDWSNSSLAYMFSTMSPTPLSAIKNVTHDTFEMDPKRFEVLLYRARMIDKPVRLLGTSYAYIKMFEVMKYTYELPHGSILIDTGGYKGLVAERTREEFIRECRDKLGPNLRYVNEYGMSELSSQFWSEIGYDGKEHWRTPYWVRTRMVNPVTFRDDVDGVLAIYDLANIWTPMAIQTEDLARIKGQALWPLGRAKGAVAKGCSLTVDQALSGGIKPL